MAIVQVTKRIEFSASHRYENARWDAERNRAVFGACHNAPGHGHNYLLDVSVRGPVDERTGMVVNLTELKAGLTDVLAEFDHKHLNVDTPYFRDRVPTTENLATVLWTIFDRRVRQELTRIRLYEDPLLYADVVRRDIEAGTATVARRYRFSAAHCLAHAADGSRPRPVPCASGAVHGHNYMVAAVVHGRIAPDTGMVTDISVLDELMESRVLSRFADRNLNDDVAFQVDRPTGENLARTVERLIAGGVAGGTLVRVTLDETHDTSYTYAPATMG